MVTAVSQGKQGAWTKWEEALPMPLSWNTIFAMDQGRLSFALRSFSDLLPTPTNLKTWGKEPSSDCPLCGNQYSSLNHILSSCKKALSDGRYRWRHDKTLQEIAAWVDRARMSANQKTGKDHAQKLVFVKEGTTPNPTRKTHKPHRSPYSILGRATDWQLLVDLKKRLVFPQDIVVTQQRPDMLLLSQSTKTVIIIELTVPWEDRLDISHQLKMQRYQELQEESQNRGWEAPLFAIEVGCRGFPAGSLRHFLKQLGLSPAQLKSAIRTIGNVAQGSSRWLWIQRKSKWLIPSKST